MSFVVVYFRSSRTSAVIPCSAVRGDIAINTITRVKWEGKWHSAKILYSGPRSLCEEKLNHVTVEGELIEDDFELTMASDSSERVEIEERTATCFLKIAEFRSEFIARMNTLQNRMVGPSFETEIRADIRSMKMELRAVRKLQNQILKRLPIPPTEEHLEYRYARQGTVESIRKKERDNKNRFPLALEREAYADLPADLEAAVESRVNTSGVVFIKQVPFQNPTPRTYLSQ